VVARFDWSKVRRSIIPFDARYMVYIVTRDAIETKFDDGD